MTYRDALTASMTALAQDERNVFVGYGLTKGGAMGTLKNVPASQLAEFPVAENLMTGAAVGMALAGKLPVVYLERADFLLNAADAIVNHLNALPKISRGEFSPGVIIRVTVGNRTKPLFTGHTHTQDFAEAFRAMVDFPVMSLPLAENIQLRYHAARKFQERGLSTMLFEYKDYL
jgi:pyruvate/2-oxoglutarate/acetoin dehydrogenase E1 component